MKIYYHEDRVLITELFDFIPKHVFECGQCFRWEEQLDGSYTGVAHNRVINVALNDNTLIISNTNRADFEKIWFEYFDLGRDYSEIRQRLARDKRMEPVVDYGKGLRILKQDEWECLISFIISTNKNIEHIKKIVNEISNKFGDYITNYQGKDYYSFPEYFTIASLKISDIRDCMVGYRDKYIHGAAEYINANREWLYSLKYLEYEEASNELKKLDGVGDKVSHCVMLFSMAHFKSFPVDIWIQRIMRALFSISGNNNEIKRLAEQQFGDYSGFAQQYLFYYAKENNIGSKNRKI
ncbi:MAG: Putative HhH-GPD:8-oxoguanine DNA glycosylase [Clostridiales bacterium 38_11]|nr:MAG: Putative HhH-GPD:8-oxoguanine DNA glycosylase [Clostridiales bacterium 38_11]HBH12750.1 8-oxoguanine DNA glycosylase [Clostridiales bacterium]